MKDAYAKCCAWVNNENNSIGLHLKTFTFTGIFQGYSRILRKVIIRKREMNMC